MYAGDVDCETVHCFVNANYDYNDNAKQLYMTVVWFLATEEDVPISTNPVRSVTPACLRPLTHACVVSPSFAQIM